MTENIDESRPMSPFAKLLRSLIRILIPSPSHSCLYILTCIIKILCTYGKRRCQSDLAEIEETISGLDLTCIIEKRLLDTSSHSKFYG